MNKREKEGQHVYTGTKSREGKEGRGAPSALGMKPSRGVQKEKRRLIGRKRDWVDVGGEKGGGEVGVLPVSELLSTSRFREKKKKTFEQEGGNIRLS